MSSFDPNAARYDPQKKGGHVESYFIKATDAAGERALWIRATIHATTVEPDRALAEAWAIVFDRRGGAPRSVAIKHALPIEDAVFGKRGLDVRWSQAAGPVSAGSPGGGPRPSSAIEMVDGATSGRVESREHVIAWNLRYAASTPPIVPFPDALYAAPLPKVKTCTPVPDAHFDGEVTVDGERWEVTGWRGMQGHNWGRAHAEHYAWCHANAWEGGEPFILEAMSGDLRAGMLPLPRATSLCVRRGGVAYDFNRPLDLFRTRSDIGLRRWEFMAENKRARIEGVVEATTGDFVGLYYPNPGGSMLYCLNASLAHARVHFEAHGEPSLTLTSRAAALEIGTPSEDHGVRMHV